MSKSVRKSTSTPKPRTNPLIEACNADLDQWIREFIEAAEQEAPGLFLAHGVFGQGDDSEPFCRAVDRIVSACHPETITHQKAMDTWIGESNPPLDRFPDGVSDEIAGSYARAGFFLGLAMGRRIGGVL